MTQAGFFAATLLIAAIVAIYSTITQPFPLQPKRRFAKVVYVIDGDTLVFDRVKQPIRLWGINAPEKDEDDYREARITLVRIVMNKRVSHVELGDDRYKRIVARLFLDDGREVNKLMIEAGQTTEACRFSGGFYGQCQN